MIKMRLGGVATGVGLAVATSLLAGPAAADTLQPRSTVAACPTAGEVVAQFVDVPVSSSFSAAVTCLVQWGVTSGTSHTTYSPAHLVTRGQMAAFMARALVALGHDLPSAAPDAFGDDVGSVFEKEINQLAATGIVRGTAENRFSPRAHVTRGQMAAFLVRAHDLVTNAGLLATSDFFEDDDGLGVEPYVNRVAEAGVAAGFADGMFRPHAPVRRDHMAAFIVRLLALVVEGRTPEAPDETVPATSLNPLIHRDGSVDDGAASLTIEATCEPGDRGILDVYVDQTPDGGFPVHGEAFATVECTGAPEALTVTAWPWEGAFAPGSATASATLTLIRGGNESWLDSARVTVELAPSGSSTS